MTMIYDPIPHVRLVEKTLVGNYEPIMRICGKIFILNLHNLEMLFMLWIEHKFLECLVPLHEHEGPQWKTFWRRFCPGPQARGSFGGSYPQIFFVPPKFCCVQKNLFQTYDKNLPPKKFILPLKPQNLATGLVLPKLCLPLEYFVLKSIRPRDVALHNFFL